MSRIEYDGLTFHYLMPDIAWHNKILWGLEALPRRPLLVADAGFMYAAKMSGYAAHYDLFTPDAGEMAFLADETAPHPFYTRGFLLQEEGRIPDLIRAAHAGENAARHLLVKGRTDYVVAAGEILDVIDAPDTPALEPIGGTGDALNRTRSGPAGRRDAHAPGLPRGGPGQPLPGPAGQPDPGLGRGRPAALFAPSPELALDEIR